MRDEKGSSGRINATAVQIAEWNRLAEVWTAEAHAEIEAEKRSSLQDAAFQRFMSRVLNG